jgi:hypothetical protein
MCDSHLRDSTNYHVLTSSLDNTVDSGNKVNLPREPSNPPLRIFPNPPFPKLIREEEPKAESDGEEKVFDRDGRRINRSIQAGDVQEDEDHGQGKQNGGEEEEVLRRLVKRWRLLENRETSGTGRHYIEPFCCVSVSTLLGVRGGFGDVRISTRVTK